MTRTGTFRCVATTAMMLASTIVPPSAEAQDRVGVTLSTGGIFETDSYPAQGFSEPLLIGSVQRVMKRFLVLEGDFSYWAHASRFDYGPHDVSGPSGVIGRVGHSTVIDSEKNWTLGVNFLARSTGAVHLFGGVGAGFVTQDSKYSQSETDCTGLSQPLPCSNYVDNRTRGPLPNLRLIGGIEVPVTGRLAILGTVRSEATDVESGSHTLAALAGVRFSLR